MSTWRRILAVALVSWGLVGGSAPAALGGGCEPGYSEIYVFSMIKPEGRNISTATFTPEAACLVLTESDGVDPRVIYPGSNAIYVRFIGPLGPDVRLSGHISGLGADQAITLRFVDAGFVTYYDSDFIEIDPLATGELTVTVDVPVAPGETRLATDVYRTVDRF